MSGVSPSAFFGVWGADDPSLTTLASLQPPRMNSDASVWNSQVVTPIAGTPDFRLEAGHVGKREAVSALRRCQSAPSQFSDLRRQTSVSSRDIAEATSHVDVTFEHGWNKISPIILLDVPGKGQRLHPIKKDMDGKIPFVCNTSGLIIKDKFANQKPDFKFDTVEEFYDKLIQVMQTSSPDDQSEFGENEYGRNKISTDCIHLDGWKNHDSYSLNANQSKDLALRFLSFVIDEYKNHKSLKDDQASDVSAWMKTFLECVSPRDSKDPNSRLDVSITKGMHQFDEDEAGSFGKKPHMQVKVDGFPYTLHFTFDCVFNSICALDYPSGATQDSPRNWATFKYRPYSVSFLSDIPAGAAPNGAKMRLEVFPPGNVAPKPSFSPPGPIPDKGKIFRNGRPEPSRCGSVVGHSLKSGISIESLRDAHSMTGHSGLTKKLISFKNSVKGVAVHLSHMVGGKLRKKQSGHHLMG